VRTAPIVLVGLLLLPVLTGCTRVAVYVEHDPNTDFDALRTFDWAPFEVVPPQEQGLEPGADERVREAVESVLRSRGYDREVERPDFLVAYRAEVDRSTRAERMDSYYGTTNSAYLSKAGKSRQYPRRTANRPTAQYASEQGALILDILQPEPRRRIWRAYARSVIDPSDSLERRNERLRQAVVQMLAQFPP
jgi:hypothetical protein